MTLPIVRAIFALSIVALGALSLIYGEPVSGLQPLPASMSAHGAFGYVTGFMLVAIGACLLLAFKTRWAAFALAALFLLWCTFLHAPIVIATPRNGSAWVGLFEAFALAGAALILAGMTAWHRSPGDRNDQLIRLGRFCFGISLPVFAATHFIYAEFVATLVPAWIPERLFWAWFTGAAHLAAGLAVLAGVQARLAALLAGTMYGLWALILHLPRVIGDPDNRPEITSLLVAVALCGAAWIVAATYAREGDRIALRGRAPSVV